LQILIKLYNDFAIFRDGIYNQTIKYREQVIKLGISEVITDDLLETLKKHYQLDWYGLHGYNHWLRVRENGLRLAKLNGANSKIIELFAFTHDNQRLSDSVDPKHGPRASLFIRNHLVDRLDLTKIEFDILCEACKTHTGGLRHKDLTVRTCWDADRLDLMRAGITPNPLLLNTPEARDPEIIQWAIMRSLNGRK
jgi:uncharacterized protein